MMLLMRDHFVFLGVLATTLAVAAIIGVAFGHTAKSILGVGEAWVLTFTLFWTSPVGLIAAAAAAATLLVWQFSESFVARSVFLIVAATFVALHAANVAATAK